MAVALFSSKSIERITRPVAVTHEVMVGGSISATQLSMSQNRNEEEIASQRLRTATIRERKTSRAFTIGCVTRVLPYSSSEIYVYLEWYVA